MSDEISLPELLQMLRLSKSAARAALDITPDTIGASSADLGNPAAQATWADIVARLSTHHVGDSLTFGAGGEPYPQQFQRLAGYEAVNGGVTRQTSGQIAARVGGMPTVATIAGGEIPAAGGVTVTFTVGYEPATENGPALGVRGSIAGVSGVVTWAGGITTFTRDEAGAAVPVASAPFVPDTPYRDFNTVFWLGRNNFSASPAQVKTDIAGCVAAIGHTRFLVVGVTPGYIVSEQTGGAARIVLDQLNADLAAIYGPRFVDMAAELIARGLSIAGLAPTVDDTADIAVGLIPRSLRAAANDVHLNTAGYYAAAVIIAEKRAIFEQPLAKCVSPALIKKLFASPPPIGDTTPNELNADTLKIRTRAGSQQTVDGGVGFYSSAGVLKWIWSLHEPQFGSELDHVSFSSVVAGVITERFRIYADGSFRFGGAGAPRLASGSGSPEGVAAFAFGPGSIYVNEAGGGAGGAPTLFIKKAGAAGTPFGWRTPDRVCVNSTPTTGGTVSLAAMAFADGVLHITPAGTIAALTVNFPGNADTTQEFLIVTTQEITALTLANFNGTMTGWANGGTLAANSYLRFMRFGGTGAGGVWRRVG